MTAAKRPGMRSSTFSKIGGKYLIPNKMIRKSIFMGNGRHLNWFSEGKSSLLSSKYVKARKKYLIQKEKICAKLVLLCGPHFVM